MSVPVQCVYDVRVGKVVMHRLLPLVIRFRCQSVKCISCQVLYTVLYINATLGYV